MDDETLVPVLEIGGTHVTAGIVAAGAEYHVVSSRRFGVTADGPAEQVIAEFVDAGASLGVGPGRSWGIATPGPFDYDTGIALFEGVGKFASLHGVDVGSALRVALDAAEVSFLNDAAAFAVGEVVAGAARGAERAVGVTLGTGVGGGFIDRTHPVVDRDDVPPHGVLHYLVHDGAELEDHFSRRALIAAYAAASGRQLDVADIAALARAGDPAAAAVFERGYGVLATVLAPWLARFGAEVLVIGGSISGSWDLLERWFLPPLLAALPTDALRVTRAALPEEAPLIGAAHHALDHGGSDA